MAEKNSHGGDNQAYDLTNQGGLRPMMMRRVSTRHNTPVQASSDPDEPMPASTPEKASLRPPMLRHNSTRMGSMRCDSTRSLGRSDSSLLGKDDYPYDDPDLLGYGSKSGRMSRRMLTTSPDDRMSAREAAAAQEASEAEAATAREEEQSRGLFVEEMTKDQQPERMSLIDLLEQTDEQMGWTGLRYLIGDEDEGEDDEDNEEEVYNDKDAGENSCCVCLVKHKGAASGPCCHSFCRLCSKELRVGNGHCPACNDFNLEIMEVF